MFINRRFERGGAERQLIELTKELDKSEFVICVMTFYDGGGLHPLVKAVPGLQLINLNKQGRWDTARFLWRSWRTTAAFRPHILVGYMKVANLLALAIGKMTGAKVVWAVRDSGSDAAHYNWLLRAAGRVERLLAREADFVIFNSQAGREHYIRKGYPEGTSIVISNGIDVNRFKPSGEARHRIRSKWQINEERPVIGMVARMDPTKDHRTFLQAAARLAQQRNDVLFVCIGDGAPEVRADLMNLSNKLGLSEKIVWEDGCENIQDFYPAFDVMSLTSYGEGFPNVVGEAMACGVPCVVTDVGDTRQVVGNTGFVVPPGNSQELVEKWKEMLDALPKRREAIVQACRQRVVELFSSRMLAARTESVLKALIGQDQRIV